MKLEQRLTTVLMAEDDEDDQMLFADALREAGISQDIRFVNNGEELLNYLYRRGSYTAPNTAPPPGLILLDLNMPKKDGREVLKEIRSNHSLKKIPVVIFTTSQDEQDVALGYDLGANSFIVKPITFESLVETMRVVGLYWFAVVELPKY